MKKKIVKVIILFVPMLAFIGLGCFLNCEKDLSPFDSESVLETQDFCDTTPPESLPGEIGQWELAGLASEGINPINFIAVNPEKPYILWVGTTYNYSYGTDAHLFKSTDYGSACDTIGTAFGNGANFCDLAFDPFNPETIFMVNGSLLAKSTDCGANWKDITGDIHKDWERGVHDIAIDPENSNILYAGTGGFFGGYLYKSVNGGNSWKKIESDIISSADCITIDPKDSRILYLATSDAGHVVKSTDAGESWGYTGLYDTGLMIHDILIDNENSDIVYALVDYIIDTDFEVDYGVMKSKDGGVTWKRFNEGLPVEYTFTPHKIIKDAYTGDFYLTLTLGDGGNTHLYKRTPSSSSWGKFNEWPRSDPVKGFLLLSPTHDMLYFGGKGLYRIRLK